MATYVKIGDKQHVATINGRVRDVDWDNRESKAITLEMNYADALETFVDNLEWSIVCEIEEYIEQPDDEGAELGMPITRTDVYDNSEFSIAGDVIDHRDGTVTVKMGKPTASEILALIEGGLA